METKRGTEMFLIFITTFIIIASTSIANGPLAVSAVTANNQQNKQHKSTITFFDSAKRHINVPESSTYAEASRSGGYCIYTVYNVYIYIKNQINIASNK